MDFLLMKTAMMVMQDFSWRELGKSIDNDCDNAIDEDATATFYADGDGDGWQQQHQRWKLHGFWDLSPTVDRDDGDPTTYPSAEELCDETDNNCNNSIDEGLGEYYYLDWMEMAGDPSVNSLVLYSSGISNSTPTAMTAMHKPIPIAEMWRIHNN